MEEDKEKSFQEEKDSLNNDKTLEHCDVENTAEKKEIIEEDSAEKQKEQSKKEVTNESETINKDAEHKNSKKTRNNISYNCYILYNIILYVNFTKNITK